jgi:hypothetical protein
VSKDESDGWRLWIDWPVHAIDKTKHIAHSTGSRGLLAGSKASMLPCNGLGNAMVR